MHSVTSQLARRWEIGSLAALVALLGYWPGAAPLSRATEQQGYAITFSDGQRIYTSQCGLNVATFLLELFQRDYDLHHLASELQPDVDGIALGRLQHVLQAHGLNAEARQGIGLADLRAPLKAGTLAVLSIKSGPQAEARHYVLAMHDRQRGFVLIDVPRQVAPLFENLDDERLSEPVALFVSRPPKQQGALRAQVAIEPAQMKLGRFDLDAPDGQNPVASEFSVRNRGGTPVNVTLEPSCSCMKLGWSGGILAPGEVRQVKLTVLPGQWGLGPTVHPIYLTFADRSELALTVEAEGVATAPYSFGVSQRSFTIDCSQLTTEPATVERRFDVLFAGAAPDQFEVECLNDWLSATTVLHDERRGEVVLTARLDPQLFAAGQAQVEGKVLVRGFARKPAETVTVRLARRDFFALDGSTVAIKRGSVDAAAVEIRPVAGLCERIEWRQAVPDREGLLLATTTREEGIALLEIAGESAPGHYTVRCELESDRGARGALYLIVSVEE